MRIAVISEIPQEGKTAIMCLLAGIFSRTQNKRAVILSATGASTTLEYNSQITQQDAMSSTAVLKALSETIGTRDEDILNYATRIDRYNLFTYKTTDTHMSQYDQEQLLHSLIEKDTFDLTLVEVKDINNSATKQILEKMDAILYVFTQNPKSLRRLESYVQDKTGNYLRRTCFVCNKYDDTVCTDKKIAKRVGLNWKDIILIPYNSSIIKFALDGRLARVVELVVKGDASVVNMRQAFVKIMQYYYDSRNRKYIRGPELWDK